MNLNIMNYKKKLFQVKHTINTSTCCSSVFFVLVHADTVHSTYVELNNNIRL